MKRSSPFHFEAGPDSGSFGDRSTRSRTLSATPSSIIDINEENILAKISQITPSTTKKKRKRKKRSSASSREEGGNGNPSEKRPRMRLLSSVVVPMQHSFNPVRDADSLRACIAREEERMARQKETTRVLNEMGASSRSNGGEGEDDDEESEEAVPPVPVSLDVFHTPARREAFIEEATTEYINSKRPVQNENAIESRDELEELGDDEEFEECDEIETLYDVSDLTGEIGMSCMEGNEIELEEDASEAEEDDPVDIQPKSTNRKSRSTHITEVIESGSPIPHGRDSGETLPRTNRRKRARTGGFISDRQLARRFNPEDIYAKLSNSVRKSKELSNLCLLHHQTGGREVLLEFRSDIEDLASQLSRVLGSVEDCFLCIYGNRAHDKSSADKTSELYRILSTYLYKDCSISAISHIMHSYYVNEIYKEGCKEGLCLPRWSAEGIENHIRNHMMDPRIRILLNMEKILTAKEVVASQFVNYHPDTGKFSVNEKMAKLYMDFLKLELQIAKLNPKQLLGFDESLDVNPSSALIESNIHVNNVFAG